MKYTILHYFRLAICSDLFRILPTGEAHDFGRYNRHATGRLA